MVVASIKNSLVLSSLCSKTHSIPKPRVPTSLITMATSKSQDSPTHSQSTQSPYKVIDSHLHVWASPQEAAEKYPYFPGQEPSIPGDVDLLLKCMKDAGVDGALIVQPITHKFDHSLVTSILRRYPSKFIGCCLANPSDDGTGINDLENLVLKDGYRAVRFNPYLWPSSQKMTNGIGKALFRKAGELGVPVGFMCMKGLGLHISEIKELCTEFPSTIVLLDHMAFCKPPLNKEEEETFSELLKLSRFPQVYVKFSALFRISRKPYPYEDTSNLLSQVVSSYGANRVMWGRFHLCIWYDCYLQLKHKVDLLLWSYIRSCHICIWYNCYLQLKNKVDLLLWSYIRSDFPFVVSECGYKEAKDAVILIANQISLTSSDLEWIMGRTASRLLLPSSDC